MKCKSSQQMPSSSILRHRCCSIFNGDHKDDKPRGQDDTILGNRIQQRQTTDRKQSFIYAFPTPTSIYDDQNFCYRSWSVPPPPPTAATTTGVNRNENINNSHKQYLLQSKHKRAYTVDYISRYIFPISFIVLNIFYWTYYLEVLVTLN